MMACIGVAAYTLNGNERFQDFMASSPDGPAPTIDEAATQTAPPQIQILTQPTIYSSSVVSILKSPDGQFWTDARANSATIKFLIDTGASVVALTPGDALRAGHNVRNMTFDVPVSTANGQVFAARILLKSVSVGAVTIRDVEALVIPEGLSVSLLGMSFLGRLQKVEATQSMMILRL